MSKNVNHIQHIKSSVVENGNPKLPSSSVLVDGELAVNYAENYETISLKNSNGDIVRFSSDNYYTELKLGSGFTGENSAMTVTQVIEQDELITSSALNNLNTRMASSEESLNSKLDTDVFESYSAETNAAISDKLDTSAFTIYSAATEESLSALSGSVSSLTEALLDDEESISAALNDLNARIASSESSASGKLDTSAFTEYSGATEEALSALSGSVSSLTETLLEDEETISAALNDLNDRLLDSEESLSGKVDTDVFESYRALTSAEISDKLDASALTQIDSAINGKLDISAFTAYSGSVDTALGNKFGAVDYDSNSKRINFFSTSTGETPLTYIDATDFIKDGMVNDVVVSGISSGGSTVECLVITFNTDAGKEDINIPLTDLFDPSLYYTKSETSGATELSTAFSGIGESLSALSGSVSSLTEALLDDEEAISAALNELNSRMSSSDESLSGKLDTSAFTEYSAATEVILSGKVGFDDVISAITSGTSASTYPVSTSAVMYVIAENEEITAAALNDLNSRILDNEVLVEHKLDASIFSAYSATTDAVLANKLDSSALTEAIEDKLDTSAFTEYSGATEEILSALSGSISSLTETLDEDELVISSSLNDLNNRISSSEESLSGKLDTSIFASYSAATDTAIGSKLDSSVFAEYSGETDTAIGNKLDISAFTAYSAATDAIIGGKVDESDVEQVLDSTVSASTNPVSAKAVYDALVEDERVWAIALNTLDNNKFGTAEYDSNSKRINFYASGNTGTVLSYIDATDFIKDGMVNDVTVSGVSSGGSTVECLVITFNTDAGKEDINIPLADLFDPSLYYTKSETSGATELSTAFSAVDDSLSALSGSVSSLTEALLDDEEAISAALNELNSRMSSSDESLSGKLDTSAFTEYSAATATAIFSGSGVNHKSGLVPDPGAISGDTKFLCENGRWVSGIGLETVNASASIDLYPEIVYAINGSVSATVFTLQSQNDGRAHCWDILMSTHSTVNSISFVPSDNNATMYYPIGYSLAANSEYEINIISVGDKYYLRYGKFVTNS